MEDETFPHLAPAGRATAQVILSSPEAPSSPTKLLYGVSVSSAVRRLWLSNSFRLNDEINLTVFDRDVGRRLEEMFLRDLARSRPYTYAQWRSRPFKQRLTEWLTLPLRGEL